MSVDGPKFGGAFTVVNFKKDGETVNESLEQNRMLARYARLYSRVADIQEQPRSGAHYTTSGAFTGIWRDGESDDILILSDDESGKQFSEATQQHWDAQTRMELAQWDRDGGEVERATWDLMDQMKELGKDALPVELEEVEEDGKPGFRLNILSEGDYYG